MTPPASPLMPPTAPPGITRLDTTAGAWTTAFSTLSFLGATVVIVIIVVLGREARKPSSIWPLMLCLAISDLVFSGVILLWRVLAASKALTKKVQEAV